MEIDLKFPLDSYVSMVISDDTVSGSQVEVDFITRNKSSGSLTFDNPYCLYLPIK